MTGFNGIGLNSLLLVDPVSPEGLVDAVDTVDLVEPAVFERFAGPLNIYTRHLISFRA